MKNVLAVLVALPFFTILPVSCGGGGGDQPVAVTMLLLGNKPTNGRAEAVIAEINKITSERIGAVLKTRYVEWADWQTKYQLALATGDPSLDLVITSTDWLYAWEIARRGGFYPLTPELLQKNAPMTWASIPQEHWDVCTSDGNIWFIPEDDYTQFTNHGFFWRKDWANEAGIRDIEKFEDIELYLDAVKRNHPEAIPWDVGSYIEMRPLEMFIMGKEPVQYLFGTSVGNYGIFQYNVNDPYTVVSLFMEGDYMEKAAVVFDRWGKKGFWRDDVLNAQIETAELFKAGLSGLDQHHTMTYLGLRYDMDIAQPGSEVQMYYLGKENGNVINDLITHAAMAVNGASKNVEKALQMYDLLRNDKEIYMLYNHGIEGVDYVILPDGRFSRPEGWDALTDNLDTNFWGGRNDGFEPVWDTWWEGRQDFLDHLSSIASPYPLEKFAFDSSSVSAEMAAMGDVCITHIPSILFGKTADPVKAVEAFHTALRQAGYDKVKAEIQRQLDLVRPR